MIRMWFFWRDERETPLTEAVIQNDMATINSLGNFRDHVLARNYLGFNALDLAFFLDKKKILALLAPEKPQKHKVIFPHTSQVAELTTEEFEKHFNIKYIKHLKFRDYPFFIEVIRSLSWIVNKKMFGAGFYELYDRHQAQISSGYYCDVMIRWIDDVLQYGLFADQDLQEGGYVGEYAGVIRETDPQTLNEYCLSYPKIIKWAKYTIDPKEEGNYSRFVNHSFEPNLTVKIAAQHGLLHCVFIANQPIKRGTQLTFNYGLDYWSRRFPPVDI